jgi:hypothetical protein
MLLDLLRFYFDVPTCGDDVRYRKVRSPALTIPSPAAGTSYGWNFSMSNRFRFG